MFKRFSAVLFVCAILLSMAFVTPLAAQNQSYFTYVSWWAVPRSDWAAFEKQEEADKPTMQKLVADGTIVAWGDVAVRVHQADGYTHADWFTAPSRALLLKALEVIWGSATSPSYVNVTKHSDVLLETLAHGGKTNSGATGYIRVTMWQAKAGEEGALEALVMKDIKPMLDAEVENGTILMYNFDKEDIHTAAPGHYNLALAFPNGEAIDKFFADLGKAQKENPTVGQLLDSLTVEKAHRDTLGRVTDYQHK